VYSTKPPNSSDASSISDIGKFDKTAPCFGDLDQAKAYYIFLVRE
jgi:hypothetical protein